MFSFNKLSQFLAIVSQTMTFQSLYELYMEDMTARLKQSTILTKKHICENHILPFFGKKPINEIKASDVRRWWNQLMNSPNSYF